MRSWLTALRIARREARRNKGRSALVLAMIALPVLALTYAAVSYDMFRLTPAEEFVRANGAADAGLSWQYTGVTTQDARGQSSLSEAKPRDKAPTAAEVRAVLPAGSRAVPDESGAVTLRTATGVGELSARALDVADPIARGLVELRGGHAPAAGEIAVTEQAAERLGVTLGGTVRAAQGDGSWRVAGIVEFPANLDERVLFPAGALPPSDLGPDPARWLVKTPAPVTWEQVLTLNQRGIVVASEAVWEHPPSTQQTPYPYDGQNGSDTAQLLSMGALIGGLGLLEVVLLAGPAFAVGARRRQRDLALVAANGGTPAHLRRIVLADGVVIGAVGAVIGIALGIALAFAARPLAEQYLLQARIAGYRVWPLALLAIAGLALVTGVLAALVPAFTAARFNLVAALTGRRGAVRSRKRWLLLGLVITATGVAATAYGALEINSTAILAGLVLGEFGLVLCTPALVGLIARLGRALPLSPRIALRDTARNRASAAPAISAVMAAVAGSVALGVYFTSNQTQQIESYQAGLPTGYVAVSYQIYGQNGPVTPPPPEQIKAAIRDTLPVRALVDVGVVGCTSPDTKLYCGMTLRIPADRRCPYWESIGPLSDADQRAALADPRCATDARQYGNISLNSVVGDDASVVAAMSGATGADLAAAGRVLAAGGVVTADPRMLVDGRATLEISNEETATKTNLTPDQYPTVTVPAHVLTTGVKIPGMILSSRAVRQAKLAVKPGGLVVETSHLPTQAEEDRMNAALQGLRQELASTVERGPRPRQDPVLYLLAAAAGLITLGAASIATGLAAADGRADLSTLAAVGASPRVRRMLSLSQSGVIAGLGSTLGIAAGLGAAFAVLAASNQAGVGKWPASTPYPLAVPWTSLLIVLAVPLVAMLGAGLLTRSRLPIERRLT